MGGPWLMIHGMKSENVENGDIPTPLLKSRSEKPTIPGGATLKS